jgi:hypothetical protein
MSETAAQAAEVLAERAEERLGLALSGGGFRAAFFHVGGLAALAEGGLLRPIRVISTVLGGSIVGALYYLRVKDLLESVPDEEIRDEHYVRIVERLAVELLEAVEEHVRALTFASLRKTFRMSRADYSRSDRLGELYDELFYRPAWNAPLFGERPDPPRSQPIEMRELCVTPAGGQASFDPTGPENALRNASVPILLLNAASLNSGHNWRFEAVGMGEPPRRAPRWVEIDKNSRSPKNLSPASQRGWGAKEALLISSNSLRCQAAVDPRSPPCEGGARFVPDQTTKIPVLRGF